MIAAAAYVPIKMAAAINGTGRLDCQSPIYRLEERSVAAGSITITGGPLGLHLEPVARHRPSPALRGAARRGNHNSASCGKGEVTFRARPTIFGPAFRVILPAT